jgi:hypothetical protein
VLIPKFTTNFAWTESAKATYGPYLIEHFPVHHENRSWSLVSRNVGSADRAADTAPAQPRR